MSRQKKKKFKGLAFGPTYQDDGVVEYEFDVNARDPQEGGLDVDPEEVLKKLKDEGDKALARSGKTTVGFSHIPDENWPFRKKGKKGDPKNN